MAVAQPFHTYADQLPRRTLDEVLEQENVEDRQALLWESWEQYCSRTGNGDPGKPRVKQMTETWEEFFVRIKTREANISAFDVKAQAEAAAQTAAEEARQKIADDVLADLARRTAIPDTSRLTFLQHVDPSEELAAQERARERHLAALRAEQEAFAASEDAVREAIRADMAKALALLNTSFTNGLAAIAEAARLAAASQENATRAAVDPVDGVAERGRSLAARTARLGALKARAQEATRQRRVTSAQRERDAAERDRVETIRRRRLTATVSSRIAAAENSGDGGALQSVLSRELAIRRAYWARADRQESELAAAIAAFRTDIASVRTVPAFDAIVNDIVKTLGRVMHGVCVYYVTAAADGAQPPGGGAGSGTQSPSWCVAAASDDASAELRGSAAHPVSLPATSAVSSLLRGESTDATTAPAVTGRAASADTPGPGGPSSGRRSRAARLMSPQVTTAWAGASGSAGSGPVVRASAGPGAILEPDVAEAVRAGRLTLLADGQGNGAFAAFAVSLAGRSPGSSSSVGALCADTLWGNAAGDLHDNETPLRSDWDPAATVPSRRAPEPLEWRPGHVRAFQAAELAALREVSSLLGEAAVRVAASRLLGHMSHITTLPDLYAHTVAVLAALFPSSAPYVSLFDATSTCLVCVANHVPERHADRDGMIGSLHSSAAAPPSTAVLPSSAPPVTFQPMVGWRMTAESAGVGSAACAPSFALLDALTSDPFMLVPDVSAATHVRSYVPPTSMSPRAAERTLRTTRPPEMLVLVPLAGPAQAPVGIVGIEAPMGAISDAAVLVATEIVGFVSEKRIELSLHASIAEAASQAAAWTAMSCGAPGVHVVMNSAGGAIGSTADGSAGRPDGRVGSGTLGATCAVLAPHGHPASADAGAEVMLDVERLTAPQALGGCSPGPGAPPIDPSAGAAPLQSVTAPVSVPSPAAPRERPRSAPTLRVVAGAGPAAPRIVGASFAADSGVCGSMFDRAARLFTSAPSATTAISSSNVVDSDVVVLGESLVGAALNAATLTDELFTHVTVASVPKKGSDALVSLTTPPCYITPIGGSGDSGAPSDDDWGHAVGYFPVFAAFPADTAARALFPSPLVAVLVVDYNGALGSSPSAARTVRRKAALTPEDCAPHVVTTRLLARAILDTEAAIRGDSREPGGGGGGGGPGDADASRTMNVTADTTGGGGGGGGMATDASDAQSVSASSMAGDAEAWQRAVDFPSATSVAVDPVHDASDCLFVAVSVTDACRRLRFPILLWERCRIGVSALSRDVLMELAALKSPPPFPVAVASCVLVLLGTKPSSVTDWPQCRPLLKPAAIERLGAVDVTRPAAPDSDGRDPMTDQIPGVVRRLHGVPPDGMHGRAQAAVSALFDAVAAAVLMGHLAAVIRSASGSSTRLLELSAVRVLPHTFAPPDDTAIESSPAPSP